MVPREQIIETAIKEKVDIIGLSGLITPSLSEMVQVAKEMERRGLTIPLLIGGATTSRIHTAVKIAPSTKGPVLHVVDASKSVVVVGNLVDSNQDRRQEYLEDTKELYDEEREEYLSKLKEQKFVSIQTARERKLKLEFVPTKKPNSPLTCFNDYPLEKLVPFIDWNPFFQVWQLRGKYPNRNYPKLFNDPDIGAEAQRVFHDGQKLLERIIKEKLLKAVS